MSIDERLQTARRLFERVLDGAGAVKLAADIVAWLEKKPGRTPWRVGSTIPRNIYDADDHDIGRMDTAELAALVVVAVNADFETERLRQRRDLQPVVDQLGRRHLLATRAFEATADPGMNAVACELDELLAFVEGLRASDDVRVPKLVDVLDLDHIPWLVKDFDVLYRAAEDVVESVIDPDGASPPLRQLRAQLERLRPAMVQIQAVKAALPR